MGVTDLQLERMPTAQVECLHRGLQCLRGQIAEPSQYFLDSDASVVLVWELMNFRVTLQVTQGGVPSTDVQTIGRIEDLPLVAGLMRFNQMLISAFEKGELPPG